MNPLFVINDLTVPKTPAEAPYRWNNQSALRRVVEYAKRIVSPDSILVLSREEPSPESLGEGIRRVFLPEQDMGNLLRKLRELSAGHDTLVYVFGDCPFLDEKLTRRMLENHQKYFADYTFADGYPYGLTPEILETRILPAMEQLLTHPADPIGRDSLFTLISKDINSFDLETELSPVDLRYLRISLTTDTKRNRLLCLSLDRESPKDYQDILSVLQGKPFLLRTVPAYLSLQITEKCPHPCGYCPYPLRGNHILHSQAYMPLERVSRVVSEAVRLCGDLVLGVSLWGEPSYYPDFAGFCQLLASYPEVQLVVETSGIGWKERDILQSRKILGERVSWIVDLVTDQVELYERMRGPGFEESRKTMELLLQAFPRTTYAQAVRMQEIEEGLESFYRFWKEKTPHVCIQKYDWFCGVLPQRKVTDLSPLQRFPCWHLKRDVSVLMDGTVPLCREDIEGRYSCGNIFLEPLEEIWDRMGRVYAEQASSRYLPLCERCDEYYTYNF